MYDLQLVKFMIKLVHYNLKWDITYTVLPNYFRATRPTKDLKILDKKLYMH